MKRIPTILAILMGGVALAALSGAARADDGISLGRLRITWVSRMAQAAPAPAQCSVVEIQASNEGKGIDPKLKKLEGKLSGLKWTSFKQLGEQSLTAALKKPVSGKLTNGGKLTLLYKEKAGDGGRPRLRLGVDIEDKEGTQIISTTTAADSGDWFLITGEPDDKGGVYILAISCTAK